MKTEHDQQLIEIAVNYLEAYRVENGETSIWNDECYELFHSCTREELNGNGAIHDDSSMDGWFFADDEALEDLGRGLKNNDLDAYSLWCANGAGVQFELVAED